MSVWRIKPPRPSRPYTEAEASLLHKLEEDMEEQPWMARGAHGPSAIIEDEDIERH